jgi:hypothetical protein
MDVTIKNDLNLMFGRPFFKKLYKPIPKFIRDQHRTKVFIKIFSIIIIPFFKIQKNSNGY